MLSSFRGQDFPPLFTRNAESLPLLEHNGGHSRVGLLQSTLNRGLPEELPDGTRQGTVTLPGDPDLQYPDEQRVFTYDPQKDICTVNRPDATPGEQPDHTYIMNRRDGLILREDKWGEIEEVGWGEIRRVAVGLDVDPGPIDLLREVEGDSSATDVDITKTAEILDVHALELARWAMGRSKRRVATDTFTRWMVLKEPESKPLIELERNVHETLDACHADQILYTTGRLVGYVVLGMSRSPSSKNVLAVAYESPDCHDTYPISSVTVGPQLLQVAASEYRPGMPDPRDQLIFRQADSRVTSVVTSMQHLTHMAWQDRPTLS